ncbi:hypothetical protein [Falsiphaeobacter marinintestinus]|uniref:hypothetical protein n=1 Tax=Falsiphaeobacter marinintestinus TaxID=1492905 RepID=UPI0011B6E401|nr:hypothetical protein [Phaeobacter marinintestinus]
MGNFPEFAVLAQVAAVAALVVTASILSAGSFTLIFAVQNALIKYDSEGNVLTFDESAVDLRKRMLRFPRKAWRFYIFSTSTVVAMVSCVALREFPDTFGIFFWLSSPVADLIINPVTITASLLVLASYAVFLGHSVLTYKKLYSQIAISKYNL